MLSSETADEILARLRETCDPRELAIGVAGWVEERYVARLPGERPRGLIARAIALYPHLYLWKHVYRNEAAARPIGLFYYDGKGQRLYATDDATVEHAIRPQVLQRLKAPKTFRHTDKRGAGAAWMMSNQSYVVKRCRPNGFG